MQNNPALFERIHAVREDMQAVLQLIRKRKTRIENNKKPGVTG